MAGKAEDPGHGQYSVLDMIDRLLTTKSVARTESAINEPTLEWRATDPQVQHRHRIKAGQQQQPIRHHQRHQLHRQHRSRADRHLEHRSTRNTNLFRQRRRTCTILSQPKVCCASRRKVDTLKISQCIDVSQASMAKPSTWLRLKSLA